MIKSVVERQHFSDALTHMFDRSISRAGRFMKRADRYDNVYTDCVRRWGPEDPRSRAASWRCNKFAIRESYHSDLQGMLIDMAFVPADVTKSGNIGLRKIDRAQRLEPSLGLMLSRKHFGFRMARSLEDARRWPNL